MYLTIIILPLLGSIVSGFFGRKIGVTGSHYISCLIITITTILAIISYFEVGFNNNSVCITLFKWLDSESFNISWSFQFDSLTVSMLIPVLIISSLVHFYSIGYMSHDPHNQRFFSYLSLFTFMMIILVTGNNYLVMFVGWEGVGVCSYLLVSFWFTRIAANQSSLAAFLTNRVGDCFLTIGMFVILWCLGNLDYSTVFSLVPYVNQHIILIIGICLLIGAMAKSSQVGLHIWLPMAMEGPTPVSALIHAATMVTAGVYLLIRSSPLLEYNTTVLLICLWLGAITTVFSSLIGLFQQDIKKIIAYSTMSQLGMMVIAIGLSSYNIAIFHLMNHAFYKGLLFLGAGAVIHAVVDNQDLRKYGGLRTFLPLTYSVILIASLSLVAFPFMTGFYSKDFILESAYGQYQFSSINVYIIAVIGAIFTTLYSVKVLYLTFLTKPNGSINYYKNAHESDIFISLPLVILAIFSIYFGFITKDIYIGLGSGFFADNSIFIHPLHEILIDTEFGVPTLFKLIPFILTLLFTSLALLYSEFMSNLILQFKLTNLGYYIFGFFNQRFLIEFIYNKFIVNQILFIGGQTTKVLDKGSVEWIGPYGIYMVLIQLSKIISGLNKGVVTDYALYILIGICFYLSIFTFFLIGLNNITDLFYFISISSIFVLIVADLWSKINNSIIHDEYGIIQSKFFFTGYYERLLNWFYFHNGVYKLLYMWVGVRLVYIAIQWIFYGVCELSPSVNILHINPEDSSCSNITDNISSKESDSNLNSKDNTSRGESSSQTETKESSPVSQWEIEFARSTNLAMSMWEEANAKSEQEEGNIPENSYTNRLPEFRANDSKALYELERRYHATNLNDNPQDTGRLDQKRNIENQEDLFEQSKKNKDESLKISSCNKEENSSVSTYKGKEKDDTSQPSELKSKEKDC